MGRLALWGKLVKVGLIVYRNETLGFSATGSSFYRYPYELYSRTRHVGGLEISRIESYVPMAGRGISLMLGMALHDVNRYDIVHNLDLAPVFPLRRDKCTLVSTAHDFQFIFDKKLNKSFRGRSRDLIWSEIILRLSTKSLLSSDYIIAVSSLTKGDVVRLGYDKNRVFVVNVGVDERFFLPKKTKKAGREFVVGYLGAFHPRKNVPFAISAFNKIDGKGFSFEVWGKKSYDYDKAVDAAAGNKNIKFMGFAPDDRIVQIYDGFDAFVFPSLYEGFGMPIVEAMSRGVPVIINKHGKIPKEVRKYCFEAEDESHMAQIIEGLREKGYDDSLRKKATDYARSFTWRKCVDETIKVYRKIGDSNT
jgi:glycosyltransferase involved in cell wall biosynthesis